jgi:hypothetical protein
LSLSALAIAASAASIFLTSSSSSAISAAGGAPNRAETPTGSACSAAHSAFSCCHIVSAVSSMKQRE